MIATFRRGPSPVPYGIGFARCLAIALICLVAMLAIGGCATPTDYRNWEQGSPVYYVKGGDTLYSIAMANDLDWQRLARWNRIANPQHLKIGQRLRLSPSGRETALQTTRQSEVASAPTRPASRSSAPAAPAASPVKWKWPLRGKILHHFSEGAPAQKGMIIAAKIDAPVEAAAPGRVVYSGDGLPGYGNLVIVKHNAAWLSAYAYNKSLLVDEGDQVSSGQFIARVGPRDHRQPEQGGHLLFQIRRQGKPVDPERYLP